MIKIPEHINWEEMRIVRAGFAGLSELRSTWTILDVLDAHEILNLTEG